MRIVNDNETAFQCKQKFGEIFIDLTAVYDTVWHQGLYFKLLKLIPEVKLVKFIMSMIQSRSIFVETSSVDRSRVRQLRNGLTQGSVLEPILFNIYTADFPESISDQYIYADDSAVGYSVKSFEDIEPTLQKDLETFSKPVCSIFHLTNRFAMNRLNIVHNNEQEPMYLGVTLDRSLTFRPHLKKSSLKVSERVNLITPVLSGVQISPHYAHPLLFSPVEYAAPVWAHSCHTNLVDAATNEAMRTISGLSHPHQLSCCQSLQEFPLRISTVIILFWRWPRRQTMREVSFQASPLMYLSNASNVNIL